jgi:hypothetical protein
VGKRCAQMWHCPTSVSPVWLSRSLIVSLLQEEARRVKMLPQRRGSPRSSHLHPPDARGRSRRPYGSTVLPRIDRVKRRCWSGRRGDGSCGHEQVTPWVPQDTRSREEGTSRWRENVPEERWFRRCSARPSSSRTVPTLHSRGRRIPTASPSRRKLARWLPGSDSHRRGRLGRTSES